MSKSDLDITIVGGIGAALEAADAGLDCPNLGWTIGIRGGGGARRASSLLLVLDGGGGTDGTGTDDDENAFINAVERCAWA
jgi:hypothetical protein